MNRSLRAMAASGALALLKNLKDKYSGAKWWDAHSGELAKTEREVQRQLDEYNNEVAGALQEVAKAGDLKSLDKIEAAWKAKAGTAEAGTDGKWTLLELVSMRAESGAAMALQNDGSILVSGNNPAKDRYIVVARTLWSGIRAFRLEAIPDASLPNKGPGRSPGNGNFALSAFKAEYAPLDNLAKTQQVSFSKATETYGQRENLASQAINNREDTWWDVFPEVGKLQVAVFETATPIGSEKGVSITFTLAFQHHNQHGLGRFRLLLTTAPTPPDAKTPTGEVNPPGAPGDELGAKPAQQILAAVGKARAHITEQHRDKNAVQIKEQLDILEKQIKFKSQPQAQLTKTFETLEAELAKDPVLAEKMVERVAGLRFDLRLSKDGELTLYKGQVKQVGSVAEVTYDFSTIEQFQAWIWDNPGNAGSVEHDPKSKLVRIKVTGQHDWTGKDRKNTPIFRLPFYFMADNWAVEATVSLVSDGGKQNKPDYGILVWDGGTDAVGLSVKDQGKEMLAQVAFSAPGKAKATALAAKTKERMVLRMDCQQGTVNCTVTGPKGLPARFKEKLGFEPHYAGLFVRTMDGGENATVAFENVKILGFPNKEKLKELADSARAEIVEVAKKHAKGEPVNIAHLGHAASRSTWKPDAAHEPAAAIDNNPNTYWDEEHDKPEYRFAVTFDQPHTVNAISISGYEQHNGAPKDFDILADGKVVLPVRNANYTGNQLRVEFPATQLKDLELKITACHGHSPTIRELGIYEP
ncbi:MAG: discoidin domain-containing protein [Planctomycetota bacterium]